MIRFLFGRSLSIRLLWLTIAVVLAAEVMVFVPAVTRARRDWLSQHVRDGQIAILVVAAAPDGLVDAHVRESLLRLSGAVSVRLNAPGQPEVSLAPAIAPAAATVVDLRDETSMEGVQRALAALLRSGDALLRVQASSPLRPAATIEVVLNEAALDGDLRRIARDIGAVSVLVALAAGAMMYLALHALLVLPMHRIIGSIVAFRANPEWTRPLDPKAVAPLANDEIAAASRELAALQQELRGALWRNARLAALGAAVSRASHDLRGILSPALLTAERLQMHGDPKVSNAGDTLVRAVERATELVRRTVEFAREGPPTLTRTPLDLRSVVEEAAEQVHAATPKLHIATDVPAGTRVLADAGELVRVFANLLRNAGEAGARHATVGAASDRAGIEVTVVDDGPGLPEPVQRALFRPFVTGGRRGGSGLGLAIAHDLVRAHGGELALVHTGPSGTAFRLSLPATDGGRLAAEVRADAKPV
jgi:signal transduction histidine kinase